jgi:NAD(P)-dependent dehydrogenase (short-subunit alcohol dehydrogenase family)
MATLAGRTCLVTGAARGIGFAVAARLAADGAAVALADVDEEAVQQAADELRSTGAEVSARRVDVSRSDEMADWVSLAARRFGRIDAIVNNAGVAVSGDVEGMSEQDWDRVVSVNLKGVWLGMKYAIPVMRAGGGGSIVNMSSVQALVGFPGWAGYAATKGAIIALTQQAAVEYGRENIRVNCLAPGTIMTPMNEEIFRTSPNPDALIADWNSSHALARFGQPTEVAAAAAFLVSDESSFVTGACLRVDGGLTILGPTGKGS